MIKKKKKYARANRDRLWLISRLKIHAQRFYHFEIRTWQVEDTGQVRVWL